MRNAQTEKSNHKPFLICSATTCVTMTISHGLKSRPESKSEQMKIKKRKYIVPVPKPHPSAYNPDRKISDLVRNQVLHLSVAERHLHPKHQSPIDVYSIETERQASEYIHHLTKKFHERAKELKPTAKKKAVSKKSARKSRKAKGKH